MFALIDRASDVGNASWPPLRTTWRPLPSLSLIQRGFDPFKYDITERCSIQAYTPPTNKEILELKFTSEKLSSHFKTNPTLLLIHWLQKLFVVDMQHRGQKHLQQKAKRLESKYNALLIKYRKSRHRNASTLLHNVEAFLSDTFTWPFLSYTKTSNADLQPTSLSAPVEVGLSSTPPLPTLPTYEEVVQMDMAPPAYNDIILPIETSFCDPNRQCLRSGASFSKSPSKARLKELKRKAEVQASRVKIKLSKIADERDSYRQAVGVRVRDALRERDTALQKVSEMGTLVQKSVADLEELEEMKRKCDTLTKERDESKKEARRSKEKAKRWLNATMTLLDQSIKNQADSQSTKKITEKLREVEKEKISLSSKVLQKGKETSRLKQRIAEAEMNNEQDREGGSSCSPRRDCKQTY
ncbi:uncharacterized protein [Ptychodera flava]|uniref:uncharacterized protein isoform X1 n=1 Tax=Ptychodera flava TaxID=63121 RepID=UPI003969CAB4